jgi:hypothetical protein
MEPTIPISVDDEDKQSTLLTGQSSPDHSTAPAVSEATLAEPSAVEYKSALPPKFYADLIFDSYRLAQGSIPLQGLLLDAVLILHPEYRPKAEDYEAIKEATVRRIAKWMRVDEASERIDVPYHRSGEDSEGIAPLARIEKSVAEDAMPTLFAPPQETIMYGDSPLASILEAQGEVPDEILKSMISQDSYYLSMHGRPHDDDKIKHKGKFLGSRVSYVARFLIIGESTESDEFDEVFKFVREGLEDYVGQRRVLIGESDRPGGATTYLWPLIGILQMYIRDYPEDYGKLPAWIQSYIRH